jgi:hypothetical protein
MFARRSIVIRILALLALLAWAGVMIYHAGQVSGAAMNLAPSANGQPAPGVPGPYYFYRGPWHFFPFAPFGLFFLCAVPFLFFFVIGGLFRPWGWRHFHHMYGHGPYGPYPWHEEKPSGETGQPAQPPAPDQTGQPK